MNLMQRLEAGLLEAERELRELAERRLREYGDLCRWLAHELGLGERLEALRTQRPDIPASWGPEEWRRFFREGLAEKQRGWRIERRIENRIETPGATTVLTATSAAAPPTSPAQGVEGRAKAHGDGAHGDRPLSPALRPQGRPCATSRVERLKRLDVQIPSRLKRFFSRPPKKRKRELQVLFLLAQGYTVRLEVDLALARAGGIKPRSGSVRRVIQSLAERDLIEEEVWSLGRPQMSLALLRLTDTGRALVRELGWQAQENEWERLMRLHEGARYQAHAVAVLIFAFHARLRGWEAAVLPEVEGPTPPDVWVGRGEEGYFVEVELSDKEHETKWRNNAALNRGTVAVVAATPERLRLLAGDIRKQGFQVVGTDLATLVATPYTEVREGDPLWTL